MRNEVKVSREAARSIAAARVQHEFGLTGKVGKVLSLDELTGRLPFIYNFSDEVLRDFWIAYVKRSDRRMMLESSTVVLVSKVTGDIAYVGTAGDEG
ncbi:MAG: hypothetical protein K8S22_11060 [Betaproteobacteria bacterium]|nr:hypothetical protein [Betaproteobacteria bacterium]